MGRGKKERLKDLAHRNPGVDVQQTQNVLERVKALRTRGVMGAEYDLLPPFAHQPYRRAARGGGQKERDE